MSSETGDEEVVAIDLFPLAVGNSWEFEVSQLGDEMPTCGLGLAAMTIEEALELDGRSAFRMVSLCGSDWFLSLDGEAVDWHAEGETPSWKRYLENPVADGHEWLTHFDIPLRWAFHGSISVPAGDFDNCWRREGTEMMTYMVYCPDVGQVYSYSPEGSYEAVLVNYTLN